jgi:hypothetical protein
MRLLVVLTAAALLAGCAAAPPATDPGPAQTYPSLPEPSYDARTPAMVCGDDALVGSSRWTSTDGAWFETGVVGESETVAVMIPQSGSDYCGFIDFALVLAGHGIQSVLLNLCDVGATTCGLEDNVVSSGANAALVAAEQARTDGATRVVVVGASMGGTTAIVAASQSGDDGRLDAVADLSGPIEFAGIDTAPLAGAIEIPMFLAVSGSDSVVSSSALEKLGAASAGGDYAVYGGTGHGWAMLLTRDGSLTKTGQALMEFVAG